MRMKIITGSLIIALATLPLAAQAQILQGTQEGASSGAAQGSSIGGPLGGIIGGAVGAGVGAATGAVGTATGIVGGVLGADQRPRFHDYVEQENYPSYAYSRQLRVGAVLPRGGVRYYAVPPEYGSAQRYRYARVNDRTVLVDPRTRRVVDIID